MLEIKHNNEKKGIELHFSNELPKGLAEYLLSIGFKQSHKDSLKWYASEHPAFNNFASSLKEVLSKDGDFSTIKLKPSFSPSKENIDHNKFSYVTISYLKDDKEDQDSYVLFDSYKSIATIIATEFGKKKYGDNFIGVDVSPRNYKRKARKLLEYQKVITGSPLETNTDHDKTVLNKIHLTPKFELGGKKTQGTIKTFRSWASANLYLKRVKEDKSEFLDYTIIWANDQLIHGLIDLSSLSFDNLSEYVQNYLDSVANGEILAENGSVDIDKAKYLLNKYLFEDEKEVNKLLSPKEKLSILTKFGEFHEKRKAEFPEVEVSEDELPIQFSSWLRHNHPELFSQKDSIWKEYNIVQNIVHPDPEKPQIPKEDYRLFYTQFIEHHNPKSNQTLPLETYVKWLEDNYSKITKADKEGLIKFYSDYLNKLEDNKKFVENLSKPKKQQPYSAIFNKLNKVIPNLKGNLENGYVFGKSSFGDNSALMDLSLNVIDKDESGRYTITLSHYYKDNGELIADPDMQIRIDFENQIAEALTYQDYLSYMQVYPMKDGKPMVDFKQKKAQNKFLTNWLSNLIKNKYQIIWGTVESVENTQPYPESNSNDEVIGSISETKPSKEQLEALGFRGLFSAEEAINKPYQVKDLQERWNDNSAYFIEFIEEPAQESISSLKKQLSELKGKKDQESIDRRKRLNIQITDIVKEVSTINNLLTDENVAFQQRILDIMVQRAKKQGLDFKENELVGYLNEASAELYNEHSISPYYNSPIPEVIYHLIEEYISNNSDKENKSSLPESKTVAIDINSKDNLIPSVLVPVKSKEPFTSHSIYLKDAAKIRELSPSLLELSDDTIANATPIQLFELSQMSHPNEYGFNVHRRIILKEWEKRGKETFEILGFPTDLNYPYVNVHVGYRGVYPLSSILGEKLNKWWHAAETYRPIASFDIALKLIDSELSKLKESILELINPKTNKPKAKEKDRYWSLHWEIESWKECKVVIQDYLKKSDNSKPAKPKTHKKKKESKSKDIRDKFSLKEFIEYGTIGFDKLSTYKASIINKAKKVMEEAILLGYAVPHDFGKGKGKYTTTEGARNMSFEELFTNVYNKVNINNLEKKTRPLFTPEKDIPKQEHKSCEDVNSAGEKTSYQCATVCILGKGYQGWNYTPFYALQIIFEQLELPITELKEQLEKETGEDWNWLTDDLGKDIDILTKKPRKDSYYISSEATLNDLYVDLIACNFDQIQMIVEDYLEGLGLKRSDLISSLKPIAKETIETAKKKYDYLDKVIAHLSEMYAEGKRPTKGYIQKLQATLDVPNLGMLWEAAELSWLQWYKMLYFQSSPFESILNQMIYFWNKVQPTYAYSDSSKEIYKQYSTPCPISAIIAQYTRMKTAANIFEPSAGNGLLLVGADERKTHVNEIDQSRLASLRYQGFSKITSYNAAKPFPKEMTHKYDVVVTNPPFARWEDDKYDKEFIVRTYFHNQIGLAKHIRLEHMMAGLALHTMKDTGRAAIIIMGHIYFDKDGFIAKYRPFFNWLFRHYKVDDVINMNSFKLYNKQGAVEKTMLILIGGRKNTPEGVAPKKEQAPYLEDMVNSFSELWNRVKSHLDYTLDTVIEQLKIELKS